MGAGQSVAGEEDGDGSGEIQSILDEWESGDSKHAAGVKSEEKTPTSLGRQHQAHDDDYSPAPPRYDQPQAAATGAPPESTLSETLMQLIPFYGGGDDSVDEAGLVVCRDSSVRLCSQACAPDTAQTRG